MTDDFSNWFFSRENDENFGMVAEYFYQDVVDEMTELNKMKCMREWLECAFEAGKKVSQSK